MTSVIVHHGDSREVLKTIPDASIDSCVCDPPYALVSIAKRLGKDGSVPIQFGKDGAYARAAKGFMGKSWDTGETAFDPDFWREVMRVLKPGGHVIAASGTRTYHRLACAVEDAGFEIRDMVSWLYGSGFPKSHDVAKGIDKAELKITRGRAGRAGRQGDSFGQEYERTDKGEPISENAKAWDGWGTALKPACEPWVVARKLLGGTVVSCILEHGTGALNIDGARIHSDDAQGGSYTVTRLKPGATLDKTGGNWRPDEGVDFHGEMKPGRWPANVIHDGSSEVIDAFPEAPGQQQVALTDMSRQANDVYGAMKNFTNNPKPRGDTGSAARFFYTAKADAEDRLGSKHPTVKPVDLMAYLCRLVTPPGGIVLDPFAGSGSTGVACLGEGFNAILIEREAEYVADIHRRIAWAKGEGRLTAQEMRQATQETPESLPLFGGAAA
jgi:DNA modification methylase